MSKSNSEKPPVKVLIIDDHPAVREALRARISQSADLQISGEAEEIDLRCRSGFPA